MKIGDTVTIMNFMLDGVEFIEGDAVLVEEYPPLYDCVPRWRVRFVAGRSTNKRPGACRHTVYRNIWPPEEVERVRALQEMAPDLSA